MEFQSGRPKTNLPLAPRTAAKAAAATATAAAAALGDPASELAAALGISLSAPPNDGKPRRAAITYVGFATSLAGREYTLRVSDGVTLRHFVILIPHSAFAAREVRFQDAPDICFAKLQRELLADPELLPDTTRLVLTAADLIDYKVTHEKPAPDRKRRVPAPAV